MANFAGAAEKRYYQERLLYVSHIWRMDGLDSARKGCLSLLRWHRHDSVRSRRGPNEAARAGSNQAGE